ncbi:DNA-binding response regulator [Gracilibacillus boraciitolerans JCM 21714]|uniref:DNA-binding response regulator n=1 Tax=Gracilibacillus boraciitolerans JCM 21714 TaxID=1298598 RepID=W4VP13_9BACI|nr:response regulator transcription factor [Gracilibacillus boraciitolerans]GAE94937.1 DNA-binding response regulator [Gracilibacillus boraciitolerans JCM 21714]
MNEVILLVEDDEQIHEMVLNHLKKEGYRVISAFDGHEAIALFSEEKVDLILLDLMLPSSNGIEIMQKIREESLVPILIMSAKDSDVDKALGLGFGADDYIGKPFSLIEMTARVNAALRRSNQYIQGTSTKQENKLIILDLLIDLDTFTVYKNNSEIRLTAKEFQILSLLAAHPNQVFTKGQLFEKVWKDTYYGDDNVINVHIRRLRSKIEDNPSTPPTYIKTIWGIGYKMELKK